MSALRDRLRICLSDISTLLPFDFIKTKRQVRFFLTLRKMSLRHTFSSITNTFGLEKLLKLLLKAEIFSYLLKKLRSSRPKIKNTPNSKKVGLKLIKHRTIKITKKKMAKITLKIMVSFIAFSLSINLEHSDTNTLPPSSG